MVSRIERLLSLLNVLMGTEGLITAERIRDRVPGYHEDKASFQRQFERDKQALIDMGLPIDKGNVPGTYPPEFGYRIRPEDALLRDPGLTPDELAALHLASGAIRLDGVEGTGGLWKLGGQAPDAGGGGGGSGGDGGGASGTEGLAALPAGERLVLLFSAATERRTVRFAYGGVERIVEPWRLDCTRGRWYLTGHDRVRDATRHYRLDRIEGEIVVGEPGDFERPAVVEAVRMEAWRFGPGPVRTARLRLDAGYEVDLLQMAPSATVVGTEPDGSKLVELPFTDSDALRSLVLSFLDHAELLAPPEARADVVAWLEAIVAGEPV